MRDRDGHSVARESMHVVCGAVERIDDPAVIAAKLLGRGGLFAQEPMIGKVLRNHAANRLLGGQVGVGHEVMQSLGSGGEPTSPRHELAGAGAGGGVGDSQQVPRIGSHLASLRSGIN